MHTKPAIGTFLPLERCSASQGKNIKYLCVCINHRLTIWIRAVSTDWWGKCFSDLSPVGVWSIWSLEKRTKHHPGRWALQSPAFSAFGFGVKVDFPDFLRWQKNFLVGWFLFRVLGQWNSWGLCTMTLLVCLMSYDRLFWSFLLLSQNIWLNMLHLQSFLSHTWGTIILCWCYMWWCHSVLGAVPHPWATHQPRRSEAWIAKDKGPER